MRPGAELNEILDTFQVVAKIGEHFMLNKHGAPRFSRGNAYPRHSGPEPESSIKQLPQIRPPFGLIPSTCIFTFPL